MSARPTAPPFLLVAAGASHLVNPGRRDALVAAATAAILARTGTDPEVRVTATAQAGQAAAQEAAAAGAPLLVVAGGDGSVRSAAAVLAGTGIVLGIVPGGTGNLLAAALGVPRSPTRAIAALVTARERPIDVGRAWVGAAATPTPFVVAAGVGFDARVMAATTERRKRSLGIGAYFATATAVAMRVRPFAVRLVVDGVVHETDALEVLVANAGELIPGLLRPRPRLSPTTVCSTSSSPAGAVSWAARGRRWSCCSVAACTRRSVRTAPGSPAVTSRSPLPRGSRSRSMATSWAAGASSPRWCPTPSGSSFPPDRSARAVAAHPCRPGQRARRRRALPSLHERHDAARQPSVHR